MKHRRLPEIDLAKLMHIERGPMRDNALRAFNAGGGNFSYEPTRASTSDLVGATTPLLGPIALPDWPKLAKQIAARCTRGATELEANLGVSRPLFDEARALKWSAVREPMRWLEIGLGEAVRYWHNLVLADQNGPFIPFFDHRRSGGLERASIRRIVYSLQHVGVRERMPDLSDMRLAVIRFPVAGTKRGVVVHFHDGSDLMEYEELDQRVRDVYADWARVSDEHHEKRRSAGGGQGPLGL